MLLRHEFETRALQRIQAEVRAFSRRMHLPARTAIEPLKAEPTAAKPVSTDQLQRLSGQQLRNLLVHFNIYKQLHNSQSRIQILLDVPLQPAQLPFPLDELQAVLARVIRSLQRSKASHWLANAVGRFYSGVR